jgi:choline dehydrogenase-like flavoprotein
LLYANALEIETDGRIATVVRGATLAGNRFSVAATVFVLAAGGIENPRILLASRRTWSHGIGNEHDLVGRFFTEHLHVPAGIVRVNRSRLSFYGAHRTHDVTIRGGVSLTECVRRREGVYGCGLSLHNADDPHDVLRPTEQPASYQSLRRLMKSVRERQRPERAWHHVGTVLADPATAAALSYRKVVTPPARALIIGCRAEQAPDPDNRVQLGDDTDCFGMPSARVHWETSTNDLLEIRRAQRIWLAEFARAGVHVDSCDDREGNPGDHAVIAAAHHIGTTRMHRDPTMGVVDDNCRIHGMANLYVTGSSVFPTAGWAPPTLTVVALALRLGDHLKQMSPR